MINQANTSLYESKKIDCGLSPKEREVFKDWKIRNIFNFSGIKTNEKTPLNDAQISIESAQISDFNIGNMQQNTQSQNYFSFSNKKENDDDSNIQDDDWIKGKILRFCTDSPRLNTTDSQTSNDYYDENHILLRDLNENSRSSFHTFNQFHSKNNDDKYIKKNEDEYENIESPSNLFNLLISSLKKNSLRNSNNFCTNTKENDIEFGSAYDCNAECLYLKMHDHFPN